MQNTPLNRAHVHGRKAISYFKSQRFDEAVESHRLAEAELRNALNCTKNPYALQSINSQIDFHSRQPAIVRSRQEQMENGKAAAEEERNSRTGYNSEFECDSEQSDLHYAIYRTIEETDSLLGKLVNRGSAVNSDTDSLKSCSTDTDDKLVSVDNVDNLNHLVGTKHPKDDTLVIEELRTLNGQLHKLVCKLVDQLDESNKEVDKLRKQVKELENDKIKAETSQSTANNLQVTTSSSGGTSPYVFSPSSETSPEVPAQLRSIPTIPELEFPTIGLALLNMARAASNKPQ